MPKDVQVHVFYIQIYCYEEVGMIHMIIFFFFNLKIIWITRFFFYFYFCIFY